jgi:chromosomal replication initiator protein
MNEKNLIEHWGKCLDIIRDNIPATAFNTWFSNTKPASYTGNVLTIFVPSPFVYEYIEAQYVDLLGAAIYRVFGNDTELNYRVLTDREHGLSINQEPEKKPAVTHKLEKSDNKTPGTIVVAPQDLDPMLKSNYSFDNFIEGLSNKLPRTAAENIALNPGKTIFNPLFLYGASGVGKTHLANAVGLKVKELYPEKRVLYVSAHLFKVQYTDSVRKNTLNDFINFYQSIDVLIIDDIQELTGKTGTQNAFFNIFNHLQLAGKQLILTSDKPPVELKDIEQRLLTRFKWGLSAQLNVPDYETKIKIIRAKAQRLGANIPEEVVSYLADNISANVREIEGALSSLIANASFLGRKITISLAKDILKVYVKLTQREITIEHIVRTVCEYYNINEETFNSAKRTRDVAQARQVAMYLAKQHTKSPLTVIGSAIGGRNHATVLHSCKAVTDMIDTDKQFKGQIEEIERIVLGKQ